MCRVHYSTSKPIHFILEFIWDNIWCPIKCVRVKKHRFLLLIIEYFFKGINYWIFKLIDDKKNLRHFVRWSTNYPLTSYVNLWISQLVKTKSYSLYDLNGPADTSHVPNFRGSTNHWNYFCLRRVISQYVYLYHRDEIPEPRRKIALATT